MHGLAVDLVHGVRQVLRADEFAGVDVDHGECLGMIDDEIAAALEPDAARIGLVDQRIDAVYVKERLLFGVQLNAVAQLRREHFSRLAGAFVLLLIVQHEPVHQRREHIAHAAVDQAFIAMDERGRFEMSGARLNGLPQPEQIIDVLTNFLLRGFRSDRADDQPHALRAATFRHGA